MNEGIHFKATQYLTHRKRTRGGFALEIMEMMEIKMTEQQLCVSDLVKVFPMQMLQSYKYIFFP